MRIEVDLPSQMLTLVGDADEALQRYPVSTSKHGAGERNGSFCTPRGRHLIRAKIGTRAPENTVFVRRRPTAERWSPELHAQHPGRDWMLTRILWLSGCEAGRNRHGSVDTMRRYIYIPGAPESATMGKPGSIGCIRMRNRDLVALFDLVPPYTEVMISD